MTRSSEQPTARFQLLRKLGEGGMGVVHEAYDRARSMRVALKRLRNPDASSLYCFKREFRALSDLSHPNIISLYELVAEEDDWYLTMEVVEGVDFITYVRHGRVLPEHRLMAAGSLSGLPGSVATFPSQAMAELLTHSEDTTATRTSVREVSLEPVPPPIPPVPAHRPHVTEVVDLERLRWAAIQLVDALDALHAAGLIHRDLKPSNVLVTAEGRVVLMDFGIVAELRMGAIDVPGHLVVGTPSYMAPEQVSGAPPTPAADWYALGVMLYLALAGRLPFAGTREQILSAKQQYAPLPPSAYVDGIPPELELLCVDLLSRSADMRPDGADVQTRLRGQAIPPSRVRRDTPSQDALFVGRAPELAALGQAYAEAATGAARCAVVQGLAGMGKTSLVGRFLADCAELPEAARPLILAGRCHERESVAYKAFDGVMDGVALLLGQVDGSVRARVVPERIAALGRLFPVLGRLIATVTESRPGKLPMPERTHDERGPAQLRADAMDALRELIGNLAAERPVIVRIEDIQWADRDSLDLLAHLLEPPAPPRVLVVATLRSESLAEADSAELAALLGRLDAQGTLVRVAVAPLSEAEQRELLARLAADSRLLGHLDAPMWRESAGHPLLITELIRCAQEAPEELAGSPALHLEDVIARRVGALPAPVQLLLELIAVAGEPTPARVLGQAMGLPDVARERAVTMLRVARLARVARVGTEAGLDVMHAKVRESLYGHLAPERRRALHGMLAASLKAWGKARPGALAEHYAAAGHLAEAAEYFLEAAREADSQLAFERAATLYRRALALVPADAGALAARRRCRAWLGLAQGMRIRDRYDEALALLEHARRAAEAHGLMAELAEIYYMRGSLLFPRGDVDGVMEAHALARDYARRAGSTELEARALSGLGDAYYLRGRMSTACAHFDDCIALCRSHGLDHVVPANLAMRGLTRYYLCELDDALVDMSEAVRAATATDNWRAEIMTRLGCMTLVLFEMERWVELRRQIEIGEELAARLGARRFEPHIWSFRARMAALEGRRAEAVELAERGLAICRETGLMFIGPMVLGVLMLVADDAAVRRYALAEAQAVLSASAASHNHLYFYRDAMEAALSAGDWSGALGFAESLEAYTQAEPVPWSQFFVDRARAIVAWEQGRREPCVRQELTRLADMAAQRSLRRAEHALRRRLT